MFLFVLPSAGQSPNNVTVQIDVGEACARCHELTKVCIFSAKSHSKEKASVWLNLTSHGMPFEFSQQVRYLQRILTRAEWEAIRRVSRNHALEKIVFPDPPSCRALAIPPARPSVR